MQTRRRFLELAVGAATISLGLDTPAFCQTWPEHPVKVIVAFAAGGNSDSIARILCQRLGKALGQSFFIENRGGNGGAWCGSSRPRGPGRIHPSDGGIIANGSDAGDDEGAL
jgi:tripartite-type tricarboxylate transporter receptor subunit TctC